MSITTQDGWHGPVVLKTRSAPKRCFGKLELATKETYSGRVTPTLPGESEEWSPYHQAFQNSGNLRKKSLFGKRESSLDYEEERNTTPLSRMDRKDGWIEIPIQRL